jgi:putative flippase GtrA
VFGEQINYLAILVLTHFIAVINAFVGHKFLTFRAKGHLIADFLRFNMAYFGVLGFSLLGLPMLVEVFHFHPLASQAMLVLISVVGTYLLHKRVTFLRKGGPDHRAGLDSEAK